MEIIAKSEFRPPQASARMTPPASVSHPTTDYADGRERLALWKRSRETHPSKYYADDVEDICQFLRAINKKYKKDEVWTHLARLIRRLWHPNYIEVQLSSLHLHLLPIS